MQKQASPCRFRSYHPNLEEGEIPERYIPPELIKPIEFFNTINNVIGKYPKLLIHLNDREIKKLSSSMYSLNKHQFDQFNKLWNANLDLFDDIDCKDIKCTCDLLGHFDYEQIYGPHENFDNEVVILYRTCKRTIFAAAKRQIKSAPVPNKEVAQQFVAFAKRKIEQFLGPYLDDFGYSYNQWYNHLSHSKQLRIDKIIAKIKEYPSFKDAINDKKFQELFHYEGICKKELQGPDGKPRMVCSIPDIIKLVMGPICWKLEEIFTDHLPCYCGGMNLTQMQDKINHYIDDGFEVVAEGDGSAFDNTQDITLKEIDRYIYRRIADKVYHVPKELFLYVSQQYYKIMDIIHVDPIKKKRTTLMTYAVLGTVFSGDSDTTLMNTARMGLYNWFTNYMHGLRFYKDYVCFSKGDDFTVMYSNSVGKASIEAAYARYWLPKNKLKDDEKDLDERQYGLGQILKFVEVGDPSTIKFCSLRAWFTDPNTNHVYLTRDPQKFYTLSQYSRKIRSRNNKQSVQYLIDQAVAIEASYKGLYLFDSLARIYRKQAQLRAAMYGIDISNYKCKYEVRKTMSLEILDPTDIDSYFFNKSPRHSGVYKMQEGQNYWDQMKNVYRVQECKLTNEQLDFVNKQIENEFNNNEFNVIMDPFCLP